MIYWLVQVPGSVPLPICLTFRLPEKSPGGITVSVQTSCFFDENLKHCGTHSE